MQQDVTCDGGNETLAGMIQQNPSAEGIYDLYVEWTRSADKNPIVTGFGVQSIASIVFAAKDDKLATLYDDVTNSFDYLAANRQIHRTHVELDITTDWAEFSILSPGAYVEADPLSQYEGYLYREKVGWNSGMTGVKFDVLIR